MTPLMVGWWRGKVLSVLFTKHNTGGIDWMLGVAGHRILNFKEDRDSMHEKLVYTKAKTQDLILQFQFQ